MKIEHALSISIIYGKANHTMTVNTTAKKVFIVVQNSEHEGFTGIEGVYASFTLAEAAIAEAEARLVEDEMEESYYYDIETSFLIEE